LVVVVVLVVVAVVVVVVLWGFVVVEMSEWSEPTGSPVRRCCSSLQLAGELMN
jgi:hypothetical protein